jgi:hypothetical protein
MLFIETSDVNTRESHDAVERHSKGGRNGLSEAAELVFLPASMSAI